MSTQAALTGSAVIKLGSATAILTLSSQAAIELSYTLPSTVTLTNFPAITYPAIQANGLATTVTVSPFDPVNIAEAGTFNTTDGSISIPRLVLEITVNVSGSVSTSTGSVPVNVTESGSLVTDLTTGSASSDSFDSGTVFNDQGSPLQPSGQVTLVGDGHFWDNDGNVTDFAGMTGGAIILSGIISPLPPSPTTAVPYVIGDDVPTAQRAMAVASLYFEEQKGTSSPRLDVPTVVKTTPSAHTVVEKGTLVTCLVDYPENSR